MANETLTGAFSDIADAIRAKGVTGTMTPLEMPTKIANIPSGSGTKYGLSWDPMIGDVDSNGVLQAPTGSMSFSTSDIKSIPEYTLQKKFQNNTYITRVDLPNLSSIGFGGLKQAFDGCTNLEYVNIPNVLSGAGDCFNGAFQYCTSLKYVNIKNFARTNAGLGTMTVMFRGCTSLELVDMSECGMVPPTVTGIFTDTNGSFKVVVPDALYSSFKTTEGWSNWADHIYPVSYFSVKFTAEEANSTVGMAAVGNAPSVNLETSTDGTTWTPYTVGNTITLANIGDWVAFRATSAGNTRMATSDANYNHFVVTGTVAASGRVISLLDSSYTGNPTLTSTCFNSLFKDCTGLTTAPELPSTTLAAGCYQSMFRGCHSLTTPPELPARTMADWCYANMFQGCTSLTTPPELPATTLASNCYHMMFTSCTSLATAPELPATTLVSNCYKQMFQSCSSLSSITLGYGGNFSDDYFSNWVNGVAASGTLWYNGTDTTTGASAIPSGWTASKIPFYGLRLTAKEANSTVSMAKNANAPTVSLEYSVDEGATWSPFVVGTTTVTLANIDDEMRVRATSTNSTMSNSYSTQYNYFVMTGQIAARGNINSLLNKDPTAVTSAPQNCYVCLFNGCTSLVDAKNLTLPCTATGKNSYGHMFENCSNLVAGPEIFATTLGSFSLEYMFNGCSVLNEVKLHYTGTINGGPFGTWMNGVQTTAGTFYYNGSSTTHGTSAIPNNWTITPFS